MTPARATALLTLLLVTTHAATNKPPQPFLGVGFDENGDLLTEELEFEASDGAFASYFDTLIIPAQKQRKELDPRISVSKRNASDVVRQCGMQVNRRILHADHRVVIVGGGPAGLSAAIYAARAGMAPLVVARDGGQLESTSAVDNCA